MADFHQLYLHRFQHIAASAAIATRLGITATTQPTVATDLRIIVVADLAALQAQVQTVAQDRHLAASGHAYLLYPRRFSKAAVLNALKPQRGTGQIGSTRLKYLRLVAFDATMNLLDLCWLSQDDYRQRLPELTARLRRLAPKQWAQFEQLSAPQQQAWARYIYSAKRPVVQNSHFEQLLIVLASGAQTLHDYKEGR